MAILGVRISCYEDGLTLVTLNVQAGNSTGNAVMQGAFRVVRRKTGQSDKILPTVMDFLTHSGSGAPQPFSWTFIDNNVPLSGEWDYIAQFKKTGTTDGVFEEMQLTAVHYKR